MYFRQVSIECLSVTILLAGEFNIEAPPASETVHYDIENDHYILRKRD